ncbi:MAG: antibiotic biosynthesis monooxygenase [Bacteroidetes bacterium]|nr:antibiotic biosynthesis monooxygenase [Bacteroidota bacterium]
MKIITVHCIAKDDRREELVALCRSMIFPSRAESGCHYYSFYKDLGQENAYFFYEEWKDQESIDKHNSSQHFLEFQPKFKALIAGEPVMTVHSVK